MKNMEQGLEINITWYGGRMRVLLEPFLLGQGRNITEVKKLVRYIRNSREPEQLEVIRQFIREFNSGYESAVQQSFLMVRSLDGKICRAGSNLQGYRKDRDRVKKFTAFGELNPDWEKLNRRVDAGKDALKELAGMKKAEIKTNDRRVKDKAFLDQVLGLLG